MTWVKQVTLTQELDEKIRALAEYKKTSASALISEAITQYIEAQQ